MTRANATDPTTKDLERSVALLTGEADREKTYGSVARDRHALGRANSYRRVAAFLEKLAQEKSNGR